MKNYKELGREYKNEFFKNGNINYFLIAFEMNKIFELKQLNQQKEIEQSCESQSGFIM